MTILQQPDTLSLSMNLKRFIISSNTQVSFVLKKGESEILAQQYDPDTTGRIEIDIRDVVHAKLSYDLRQETQTYEQANLSATFTASIDGTEVTFVAVRAGVDRLADTPTNFLTQNWLTWQPTVKPVTYYSPECLTYYAVTACTVKLQATMADKSTQLLELAQLDTGKAYTIPTQYSVIVGKLGDKKPAYYDVWVENETGQRLTYIQRYYADSMRSISEDWVLFENSLGGLDCFRAYGTTTLEAEHTHNIAEIDEVSEEYRVDTERKFEKNTGHLGKDEAKWLLDFFPSQKKYLYTGSYLRQIVVVESNVTGNLRELPTSYTFTYKYADARPLLNLPRTDVPADMLDITIPEVGNFTVPPRLAEVPRLPLSEGDLFPVQNPYSENWGTTTLGAIAEIIGELLSASAGGGGGDNNHSNNDLLDSISYIDNYLLVNGYKIKAGYADKAGDIEGDKFLRKDRADATDYQIDFKSGMLVRSHLIDCLILESDTDKAESSDTAIYSALMTDKLLEDERLTSDKRYLRKDQADATDYQIDFKSGMLVRSKRIDNMIRYYDEEKEVATDANIYSALMTDKRIKDELGNFDERYLRKDVEDTAHKHISFEEGITVYDLAKLMNLDVQELATIAQAVVKILRSEKFVDGFAGEGYRIWQDIASGDWCFTIDRLTVRKVLTIYELVLQKIRSVGGMVVVSAANGKVKSAEKIGNNYVIEFEDTNMFVEHDLMRCQVFSASGLKYYWVEISAVNGNQVIVPVAQFDGVVPAGGDECVLMGNTTNKLRQNLILISATEDGQPRFDCLDGVKSKSLDGCLKVRVGALSGISDSRFPADMQPQGYGLYGNNCYLTGIFVLANGKDVMTMFTIMEGMIKSEISSVRQEINEADNYLSNASFSDNLQNWTGSNNIRIFRVSNRLLYFNSNFYANKEAFANIISTDEGRVLLRLKDSSITQNNSDFSMHPEFELVDITTTGEDGAEVVIGQQYRPRMFFVSFRYKVNRAGTLRVYFKGESGAGFEEYSPINYTESLQVTDEFKQMEIAGKWSGTGDFYLSFTGDMYLYSLALADNALADLEEKFTMQFEMTDKKIQVNADEIKKTGEKLEEYHSEFLITAQNLSIEFSQGLSDLQNTLTEEYKSYVNLTAKELTAQFTADMADMEEGITEAYTAAIQLSAEGLLAQFTADLTDLKEGVTEEYTAAIQLSAEGLLAQFTADLTDLKNGVTEEYTAAIELSAEGLLAEFSSTITDIDGKITTHTSSFHVTSEKIETMVAATDDLGTKYSAISQTVDSISATVSDIDGSLSTLTQTVDGINATVTSVDGKYAELSLKVDAISAVVGDGGDGSFSEFVQTVEGITATVTSVQTDLTTHTASFHVTSEKIETMVAATDDLDTKYSAISQTVDSISATVSGIDGSLSTLTQTVEEISATVSDVDGNVSTLTQTVEDITATVTSVQDDLTTHTGTYHVTSEKIEAMVTATDELGNKIASAGWITSADGNLLWVARDGVISSINQSAESVTIDASKINLKGKVTISDLATDVVNDLNAKASVDSLGVLAYKDAVSISQLDSTIIEGGYIKTSLINADLIIAKTLKTSVSDYNISLDNDGFVCNSYQGITVFRLCPEYVSNSVSGILEISSFIGASIYKVQIQANGISFYRDGQLTKYYSAD